MDEATAWVTGHDTMTIGFARATTVDTARSYACSSCGYTFAVPVEVPSDLFCPNCASLGLVDCRTPRPNTPYGTLIVQDTMRDRRAAYAPVHENMYTFLCDQRTDLSAPPFFEVVNAVVATYSPPGTDFSDEPSGRAQVPTILENLTAEAATLRSDKLRQWRTNALRLHCAIFGPPLDSNDIDKGFREDGRRAGFIAAWEHTMRHCQSVEDDAIDEAVEHYVHDDEAYTTALAIIDDNGLTEWVTTDLDAVEPDGVAMTPYSRSYDDST